MYRVIWMPNEMMISTRWFHTLEAAINFRNSVDKAGKATVVYDKNGRII